MQLQPGRILGMYELRFIPSLPDRTPHAVVVVPLCGIKSIKAFIKRQVKKSVSSGTRQRNFKGTAFFVDSVPSLARPKRNAQPQILSFASSTLERAPLVPPAFPLSVKKQTK